MKRMNLIRVALFAVFAFMGSISLSAQSWISPPAAIVVVTNELKTLTDAALQPAPQSGVAQTHQQFLEQTSSAGCVDCGLKGIKIQFLFRTLKNLKEGMDTGPAVEETRTLMILNANNNPGALNLIQTAYLYMDSII